MRTDPRKACANEEERLFWALVHDGIAHPLMAATLFSAWSVRFHDWTSRRAWPRKTVEPVPMHLHVYTFAHSSLAADFGDYIRSEGIPFCTASIPQPDGSFRYEVRTMKHHPVDKD